MRSSGTGGRRWIPLLSLNCWCLTFFSSSGWSQSAFSAGGPVVPSDPGQGACPQASPHPVPSTQLLLFLRLNRRSPLLIILLPSKTSPGNARHCLPASQLHAGPAGRSGDPEDVHPAPKVWQEVGVQARCGSADGEAEGGREAGESSQQISFVVARTSPAAWRPQEHQAECRERSSFVPRGSCGRSCWS